MNQSTSGESKAIKTFPWDFVVITLMWLFFAYYSVAYPHKTFRLSSFIEVPMTPLLLFFAATLVSFVDAMATSKLKIGEALSVVLFVNVLVFLPIPIAWFLLSFYEVSTFPSFLAVLICPAVLWASELKDWSESRKTQTPTSARGVLAILGSFKLIGIYVSALFFGYGTIITIGYLYCYFTNQSFEIFARANPAVLLLGGATIMAGLLALSKSSR